MMRVGPSFTGHTIEIKPVVEKTHPLDDERNLQEICGLKPEDVDHKVEIFLGRQEANAPGIVTVPNSSRPSREYGIWSREKLELHIGSPDAPKGALEIVLNRDNVHPKLLPLLEKAIGHITTLTERLTAIGIVRG